MTDLPPALTERARSFAAGELADKDVAAPRNAATVVLLRDAAAPAGRVIEVYLLRRVGSMAFAAGMHVFPGGSVDPRDVERSVGWAGPDPSWWAGRLGCDERMARALVCAAVRETFEESGVLLAGPAEGRVVADTSGDDWEADRLALLDRSLSLADLMARRRLVVRTDLLRPWAHWVTPEFEPRRFDTRFFVAAVPTGQRTRDVGGEADRVAWLPVGEGVRGYDAGEVPMLPPTIVTLRELTAYDDVAAVLASTPAINPLMPRPVLDGDDLRLVVDVDGGQVPADRAART
ncbi:MAG: NUDIX hydrolase [Actinomycetes bacterium]